jgi:hypothetical protein
MYPFSQTAEYPQATLAFAYKTATVNSTIDPSVFDMPKQ